MFTVGAVLSTADFDRLTDAMDVPPLVSVQSDDQVRAC
ncbi:hypothetical protein Pd630_LPD16046 (plasmid) [Rhodococcus opacus PD630]|nr:hypothetical protein Pd630_LPD16046 [Rhodococcus opacus PD630]